MNNGTLEILHTGIFTKNLQALEDGYRYIINQGGSRSSKTYSILQLLIYKCLTEKISVSIVRTSLPTLKRTAMKDFIDIMKELELYVLKDHQRTEHRYNFKNGSQIDFIALDSEQKIRGSKRDILYCNEGNELEFAEFNQLMLRTSKQVFIDFNPSDNEHFIYDLIKDPRSVLIKSNYKDNPFLGKEQIDYIEGLINVDDNYYKIYALGERPTSQIRIYNHFRRYTMPPPPTDWCYGMDFGFNDPTVLLKVMWSGKQIFVEELIYESKLTTSDIIIRMKELRIDNKIIYCDHRPEVVTELRRAGFNAKNADKRLIKEGIDTVKSTEVYISEDSENTWKESKMYCWKSEGETILDIPIDLNNHAMDALRYAIHSHKGRSSFNMDKYKFY